MKILIITILVLLAGMGIGQTKTFSLSGTVSDSVSKEILMNTSVSLRGVNAQVKRLSVTNSRGYFMIDNLEAGDYILDISHVGFLSLNKMIRVTGNEVMSLELQKTNSGLAGVTVSTLQKIVTRTTDKIAFNVSESAVLASDNLYNIILHTPGVVESNGSLYYQGKPVNVVFDGKSNNLSGEDLKDYLSSILGTNTDKLEILLNPSSRHDAQGGIVINIKLQKNKNYGLTKSITLGIGKGTYFRSPLGFSLNYRDSTINIYGGYDRNYTRQFFHLNAFLTFANDPSQINMSDHNIRTQDNHSVRLGIDYDLNKKTTAGLLLRCAKNFRKRKIFDLSLSKGATPASDTEVTVDMITDASFLVPTVNLYIIRKISARGAELMVNVDYWGLSKKWEDIIAGFYNDDMGNPISSYNLTNNSPANNSVKSVTADYYLPLKNGNIEAGVKFSGSRTDNYALWERLLNNEWEIDSSKTNHFVYTENLYAAYTSVSKNYKKWSIQAGIRFELTRSVGNSITLARITVRRYNDLFPSLSVQYKPSNNHLLSFTYKKSIKRFGFDIINPFINLQGHFSYHKGNPYIRPSYFNSLGINWSYKKNLVVSSSFSLVNDPISYAYEKGPDNTSHGTFLNFSSSKLLNFSVSYTGKLFKGKLTSITSLSFSHAELPDFESNIQNNNSYALTTLNTIALPAKFMFEISGFYNSPALDGTVWQNKYYGVSAGIARQVLKSKGSLKLSCTDIFDTQIRHFKTRGRGINIISDWKVESRFVNLLFTYRFGNLNVKQNKNRKTGIEEEKDRMGVN